MIAERADGYAGQAPRAADAGGAAADRDREVLVLERHLGFGGCRLCVIVPEEWHVREMAALREKERALGRPLRVATKFPRLAAAFFEQHGWPPELPLVVPEGTLEVAPAIGYADVIVDLVSSGTTMRDNRLVALGDGTVLQSEACLVASRHP